MHELGADVGKANANVRRFALDRGTDQPQERLVEMTIVARNLGPNRGCNARRQGIHPAQRRAAMDDLDKAAVAARSALSPTCAIDSEANIGTCVTVILPDARIRA